MASITDICNLAVANLGHRAVITAVFPLPDGSQEAALCNRFYSLARDTVLELHEWGFATKRVTLADLGTPPTGWLYRYAMPANVIHPLRIVEHGGTAGTPFAIESDGSGTVLLSNYSPAELHYTARIEDTTKYSPQVDAEPIPCQDRSIEIKVVSKGLKLLVPKETPRELFTQGKDKNAIE